jgi:ribose-phosphate pyrophosphokinase
MKNIKIFACKSAENFTKEICEHLDLPLGQIDSFKFKNDNNFIQIKETVREQDVYIVQTVQPPVNERIMELLITIDAIKRASAARINVILPYFPYSRSDKKDQPRVPVTAKLIASILETAGANRVLTCDLHNPAIQAYFNIQCDKLEAQYLLRTYFKDKKIEDMLIVATDAGSSKKAYKYAEFFNCPIALIDKRRLGNDDKAVATTIIGDVKGKNAIIFDDEVDTAGSLTETANLLEKFGAKKIYAGCTHGVLSGPAIERIAKSAISELVVTNTIPVTQEKRIDKITVLSIAGLFAEAIKRINEAEPLGTIYDLGNSKI